MPNFVTSIIQQLRAKGPAYWATALVVLILSLAASQPAYRWFNLTELKAEYFQWLLEKGPRPPEPNFVKLVLIDDDEYWEGYLAGRRPVKRDYLAELVTKIAAAGAHVVALDFDVRLPNPKVPEVPSDYRNETEVLINAINAAADSGTRIVLGSTLSRDRNNNYVLEPNIYTLAGLCPGAPAEAGASRPTKTVSDAVKRNVTCGYIELPYEELRIPGLLQLADGTKVDSFGLAVARAVRPNAIPLKLARIGTDASYTNFISEEKFDSYGATMSARDVRAAPPQALEKLRATAAIVGGRWSLYASHRGPTVDVHRTPLGWMVGAVLHANFAEALLDSRTYAATPRHVLELTEFAFGLFAAVGLALFPGFWMLAVFAGMAILLLAVQWAALHGFGLFFDAFVPLLGLGVHAFFERVERSLGRHKGRESAASA
jgi:hypothetical protein